MTNVKMTRFGDAVGLALTILILVPDNAAGRWFTVAAIAVSFVLIVPLVRARTTFLPADLWLLIGLYIVIALGTIGQANLGELFGLLQRAVPMVLMALCARQFSAGDRKRVTVWLIGIATAEAALGLLQQYFHVLPTWGWLSDADVYQTVTNEVTGGIGRAPGTMSHGIPLGLLIGLAIVLVLSGQTLRNLSLRLAWAAFLGWGLVQTGSRSSVIVLALTLVLMSVMLIKNLFLKCGLIVVLIGAVFGINVQGLRLISSLQGTDSLTHRASSLDTLGQLLSLGPWNAFFGNGWSYTSGLARAGVGSLRILAIDNGFVSMVALAGVTGLILFLGILARGLRFNDPTSRFAIIFVVGMFMSFDVELWMACFAPLIVFCFQTPSLRRSFSTQQVRGDLVGSAPLGVSVGGR